VTTPYFIQKGAPLKTKFLDSKNVITMPHTDISDEKMNEMINLLQCHYHSSEDVLYFLDKPSLETLLKGHRKTSYISLLYEDQYRLDPSNAALTTDVKMIGCMTSRPLRLFINGSHEFLVYYWDHICINRDKEIRNGNKNPAQYLIQTHEYYQRVENPEISASLFHRERDLCVGVVPLVQYSNQVFQIYKKIRPPPLPSHFTVTAIGVDVAYDILHELSFSVSELSKLFNICIFPDITSIGTQMTNRLLYIYAVKYKNSILGLYVLKDGKTTYDIDGNGGNVLECVSSVEFRNGKDTGLFFAGFLQALHVIMSDDRDKNYRYIKFTNLGHNDRILTKWRWKYNPVLETLAAYYVYNMVIPGMPFIHEKCFIIY